MKNLDRVIEEFKVVVDSLEFVVLRGEIHINLDMRGSPGVEEQDPHRVRYYDFYLSGIKKGRAFSRNSLELAIEAYCLEKYNTGDYPDVVVERGGRLYGRYSNVEVLLC